MEKVAVVVVPHEDDMEILGFHAVHWLIQQNYKIIEIVMTDGRFGLEMGSDGKPLKPEFGGQRLKKIRRREMLCAAKNYGRKETGENYVDVVFMDYVDGFLPLNHKSIERLKQIILKYKPQVTIGMDPFYPIDSHHDHLNTGRNYYFALKSITPSERPEQMYYIQSYKNDVSIPMGSFDLQKKVLRCHQSQLSPLKIKYMGLMKYIYIIRSLFHPEHKIKAMRRVTFNLEENTIETIGEKIMFSIAFNLVKTSYNEYENLYKPLPKIGKDVDEIKPEDFDNVSSETLAEFYFGKQYKNQKLKIFEKKNIL
ncbi:MAG: hypothetical protein GF364_02190 [Candidatus Lokiarchaeota archaeon]|nr:hypothetical protein [Candidatus Lokiarchaeota archaeon]